MEKTFLAREDFHKRTELDNRLDHALVNLVDFRLCDDGLYTCHCLVHVFLVDSRDCDNADAVHLVDGDDGVCVGLDFQDNLSAGADDSSDVVLRNSELRHARNERLVVRTRLGDCL